MQGWPCCASALSACSDTDSAEPGKVTAASEVPPGSPADRTGFRVVVDHGGHVTLDAIGDPDRLAQALDSLQPDSGGGVGL